MILLTAMGALFVVLGFVIKAASDSVVEYSVQYDGVYNGAGPAAGTDGCWLQNTTGATGACTVSITVTSDMAKPVFVYYQLDNFYQNHRRYVQSRSDAQLAGTFVTSASDTSVANCAPLITTTTAAGVTKLLHPCGLIAMSFFNDTIALAPNSGFAMSETGIAWATDRSTKFVASLGSYAQYGGPNGALQFLNESYPNYRPTNLQPFVRARAPRCAARAR